MPSSILGLPEIADMLLQHHWADCTALSDLMGQDCQRIRGEEVFSWYCASFVFRRNSLAASDECSIEVLQFAYEPAPGRPIQHKVPGGKRRFGCGEECGPPDPNPVVTLCREALQEILGCEPGKASVARFVPFYRSNNQRYIRHGDEPWITYGAVVELHATEQDIRKVKLREGEHVYESRRSTDEVLGVPTFVPIDQFAREAFLTHRIMFKALCHRLANYLPDFGFALSAAESAEEQERENRYCAAR